MLLCVLESGRMQNTVMTHLKKHAPPWAYVGDLRRFSTTIYVKHLTTVGFSRLYPFDIYMVHIMDMAASNKTMIMIGVKKHDDHWSISQPLTNNSVDGCQLSSVLKSSLGFCVVASS